MNIHTPEEQLKEILERYIKGECTEQEIALLERWYHQVSKQEEPVKMVSAADEERLVRALKKAVHRRESKANRRMLKAAAIWTGIIVVSGGVWGLWNKLGQRSGSQKPADFMTVATGYQQVRKVTLPDSSVVWLNSATHLAFHPDFLTHREVRLTGEAFFQVRPDPVHPFVVRAGNAFTRVLGTAFNVSAYPEAGQVRVSLQSGRVGVAYDGVKGKAGEKILSPGELLIYDKESGKQEVMQQAPGEMDVWTAGQLIFYKTPMKEALAQIEARYGVHIIYDHTLKNQTITARFENTALEKVLAYLSFGWELHFTRDRDTLHVR